MVRLLVYLIGKQVQQPNHTSSYLGADYFVVGLFTVGEYGAWTTEVSADVMDNALPTNLARRYEPYPKRCRLKRVHRHEATD